MRIEQLYTECLSHAAYYMESDGEVAIFDPLRDVSSYISKAEDNSARIKYIFETHFHADFVSGHLDLKKRTGADIVFGPTAEPFYEAIIANDGDLFQVGSCFVKIIHTPGHTMESTTYLISDENGLEHCLITGDTLFIDDVGRPDLVRHVNKELTQEKLARLLFHSLRKKIMPLADNLIVYPNHGAGSACGKKMSKETSDTLGHQKESNYALRPDMTEGEFISEVLNGLTTPPGYFPKNVLLNIKGYNEFKSILDQGKTPIELREFEKLKSLKQTLILDTRTAAEFAKGFIPDSMNVGLDGKFANWVGEMVPNINQEIILVTDPGMEEEAITRLSRVGYDHTIGYLKGGFEAWKKSGRNFDSIERLSASEFEADYDQHLLIFDVRKKSEYDSEHVEHAINVPLNAIHSNMRKFPKDKHFIIYCAGGYRSMIAVSILKGAGIHNFNDVQGGFSEIKNTSVPQTTYNSPVTLL